MQRNLLALTWKEFDSAVLALAPECPPFASGLYGIPRGGLPLAVALSHRTGLPLLQVPDPAMVLVDDIVDTGRTLRAWMADYPKAAFVSWVARGSAPGGLKACLFVRDGAWVVFPWEDAAKAKVEMRAYAVSRQ